MRISFESPHQADAIALIAEALGLYGFADPHQG
jgi:hypothetical protein